MVNRTTGEELAAAEIEVIMNAFFSGGLHGTTVNYGLREGVGHELNWYLHPGYVDVTARSIYRKFQVIPTN